MRYVKTKNSWMIILFVKYLTGFICIVKIYILKCLLRTTFITGWWDDRKFTVGDERIIKQEPMDGPGNNSKSHTKGDSFWPLSQAKYWSAVGRAIIRDSSDSTPPPASVPRQHKIIKAGVRVRGVSD